MKRLAPLVLVAAIAITITSCDFAKVNGKCRVGAPLARDNTHVLRCDGGRWKRFITIQEAAEFILGQLPGSIAPEGAVPGPGVSEPFSVSFKATTRAGGPSVGETVTVTGPATGPGIVGSATAVTNKSGIAMVNLTTNNLPGAFELTAKVGEVSANLTITIHPRVPATITVIKGGPQQSLDLNSVYPFETSVKVLDNNALPVAGVSVTWQGSGAAIPKAPTSVTDVDGVARMLIFTGPVHGSGTVTVGVVGTILSATMSGFVV